MAASVAVIKIGNVKDVCEIGTGSGYVMIELVKRYPYIYGVAIDVSEDSVKVAKINAKNFSAFNTVDIVQCYSGSCLRSKSLSLCFSNPPYLPCPETQSLSLCSGIDEKIFKDILIDVVRVAKNVSLITASTLTVHSNILDKHPNFKIIVEKFTGLDRVKVYIHRAIRK